MMNQLCRILLAVCISLLVVISPVVATEEDNTIGMDKQSASVLVTAEIKAPADSGDHPDSPDPETGDPIQMEKYVILLVMSSAGVVFLCIWQRKNNK